MKQLFVLSAAILLFTTGIKAQQDTTVKTVVNTTKHDRNFIKVNLAALVVKNYSFQYERVLTKRLSLAIGFRTAPMSGLPFKSALLKAVGDDEPETKRQIENLQLGNTAITPELRFYVGKKGYGKGFYFAPFYRHGNYEIKGFESTYDSDAGGQGVMSLNGKISANTYGLLLGSQFFIGKRVTLDMWYLGPHVGKGKGTLTGTPSKPLSAGEQEDLRKDLEDVGSDIDKLKTTVDVSANKAVLTLDGPFGGLRFGIVLGIKF